MAYLPGVRNDLFISYAHVDNERDSSDVRWVSEFVRGFTVELRQRLGGPKDFTLFFDESDLQAHHRLEFLLENARQSAIFVAVLSPSYVAHDWTMKELREFATFADDTRRIIVVEKLPLETSESYPPEIEQHKRTQFWRTNEPESHTPSTLTVYGRPGDYRGRLETLADQVQRLMREMRRAAEPPEKKKSEPAPSPSPTPPAPPPTPAPKGWLSGLFSPPRRERPPSPPATPAPHATGLLIDRLWPQTESNRGTHRKVLVGVASLALFLAYLLGSVLDETASRSFSTIYVPLAVFLAAAAALGLRLIAIATLLASVPTLLLFAATFSHFKLSAIFMFWLGLIMGQLAAAFVVHRMIKNPPSLVHIIVAMVAAGATYEFFDTAGHFLGLWAESPSANLSEAWNNVADHVIKNEYRWYSAVIGAAAASAAVWTAWRIALTRTP